MTFCGGFFSRVAKTVACTVCTWRPFYFAYSFSLCADLLQRCFLFVLPRICDAESSALATLRRHVVG
jgi:hypothetical protein